MTATQKPEAAKLGVDELKALLRRLRGCIKPRPGEKPFAEAWAEYKREEKELEEAKFLRMERAGLFSAKRNPSLRKSKSTG
jgi:hypothetical protein